EIAANLWRLWVLARDDAKGRAFLARILDLPERAEASRARALALYGDGLLAFRLGDLPGSRARSDAALETARAANDREAEGRAPPRRWSRRAASLRPRRSPSQRTTRANSTSSRAASHASALEQDQRGASRTSRTLRARASAVNGLWTSDTPASSTPWSAITPL